MNTPGESPEALRILCESMIRRAPIDPWTVWVLNDFVKLDNDTVVPFTTDYMLDSFAAYLKQCQPVYGSMRNACLVGDGTHDQTSQRLKKIVIGVIGTHFHRSQWSNTILPAIYCACAQESIVSVRLTIQALIHALRTRHDMDLHDYIKGW